jgi:hypothetical protein
MVCISASTAAHHASIEAGHDENSTFFVSLLTLCNLSNTPMMLQLSPLETLSAAVASPMCLSQRLPPWSAVTHTAMIAGISTSKFRSVRATAGGCFVWLSNVAQSVMTGR